MTARRVRKHNQAGLESTAAHSQSGGFGITVGQLYDDASPGHRGELVILDVLRDSPAETAGLRPGQIVSAIDGVPTKGRPFDSMVRDALRGSVGSTANLQVRVAPLQAGRAVVVTRMRLAE